MPSQKHTNVVFNPLFHTAILSLLYHIHSASGFHLCCVEDMLIVCSCQPSFFFFPSAFVFFGISMVSSQSRTVRVFVYFSEYRCYIAFPLWLTEKLSMLQQRTKDVFVIRFLSSSVSFCWSMLLSHCKQTPGTGASRRSAETEFEPLLRMSRGRGHGTQCTRDLPQIHLRGQSPTRLTSPTKDPATHNHTHNLMEN